MEMRRFVVLSALVGGILVGGCSKPATLTGQIFIVTQGRENVKLGLVEVRAVPEKGLKAFQDAKVKALLTEYDTELKEFQACKDMLAKMQGLTGTALEPFLRDYEKSCGTEEFDKSKFGRAVIRMQTLAEGGPFLEALPATDAVSAKTDADGRYTLTLRRGERYAIAARAERQVPGQEKPEQYRWLLWVQMDGEKKELLLSNDNQMDQNTPDAVVKLPKLPRV